MTRSWRKKILSSMKRLANIEDSILHISSPLTPKEIGDRISDYNVLSDKAFAKKYTNLLFEPVEFEWDGVTYQIQANHCTNNYCKWYSHTQIRFEKVKYKPKRYKLHGTSKTGSKMIMCNPDPTGSHIGTTWDCTTTPLSNWSVAEEIQRLVRLETVKNVEKEYEFHKDSCSIPSSTPFDNPKEFYKRGKSSSNSQRYQCKTCKKFTNVLPKLKQSFNYNQKRNEILVDFANLLLSRNPVKRTCEILNIGSETYYNKLEWLYRRCIEFLDRYERKALQNKEFKTMWLNTDKLIYLLNNVRKKGEGGARYDNIEDKRFPTHIVVTGDVFSRYIFRSDVAYDWDVSLDDIALDTVLQKEDHLHDFAKKYARLRIQHFPIPPTKNDSQTQKEYLEKLEDFDRRRQYTDGLNVNPTYTTFAHYWLTKQLVNAYEWRFVTDEDQSIMTALFRVFSNEIKLSDAHHFLCKIERSKSKFDAFQEYKMGRNDLKSWGTMNGYERKGYYELAYLKLCEELKTHQFHEEVLKSGRYYKKYAKNPIEHPLPMIDQGFRTIDCTTDLSSLEPEQVANLVLNVNDKTTSAFMQQIRRRISILERPLVTARGDGKSYIYANCNPKYAQYAITILRTFYNFCLPYKSYDGIKKTPAQRLGITDKVFDIKDIIYFK